MQGICDCGTVSNCGEIMIGGIFDLCLNVG